MSFDWFFIVCQAAVVASGLVSGVFLTFSDFVMRSLKAAGADSGIRVMQIVNREVYATMFMVLLLGMSALCLFMAAYAWFAGTGFAFALIAVGSAVYIVGVFCVTLVFNVPMNNRLEALDHTSAQAADYWTEIYLPRWTFWNSFRTAASAGSAVIFLIACLWQVQGQA